MLTRRWNAEFSGVFVKKTKGIVSNPYLKNPDITTIDGDVYTKKNPALMTREVSQYADLEEGFTFHITSLNPLNPGNKPDAQEKRALESFEKGEVESYWDETSDGKGYFRYMAPLFVEASCLSCHEEQGYKLGDVRGGISVMLDVTDTRKELTFNMYIIAALSIATAGLLLGSMYFLFHRMAFKLNAAYRTIERLSLTDELTGLNNRRFFQEKMSEEIGRAKRYGRPMGLLLLDIDHFKKVNDTYGHQTGDCVLRELGTILRNNFRAVDCVARYGGEEIVVLLPETELDGVREAGDKIRRLIEGRVFSGSDSQSLKITISGGAAVLDSDTIKLPRADDKLIQMADEALYLAKKSGRNRIMTINDASSSDLSNNPGGSEV